MAAAIGNQYAAKDRQWKAALERALEKRGVSRIEALEVLAGKLLERCDAGDMTALKELGDRLDGKPAQAVDLGSDPERPLVTKLIREIVRTKD